MPTWQMLEGSALAVSTSMTLNVRLTMAPFPSGRPRMADSSAVQYLLESTIEARIALAAMETGTTEGENRR